MLLAQSSSAPDSSCLGVMAKHWSPGEVKTRLAASIGDVAAAELHLAFLQATLARLRDVAARREIVFAPAARHAEFAALAGVGSDWSLQPQGEGDLGQRMRRWFDAAFARGAEKVVLIGADSPTLPTAHVHAAIALLDSAPVVLGPSEDGGYCLIGAARVSPPVFDAIEWSTSRVFEQTIAALRRQGIPWKTLPPWYDIDDEAGLARLREELQSVASGDAHLLRLREAVERALRSVS